MGLGVRTAGLLPAESGPRDKNVMRMVVKSGAIGTQSIQHDSVTSRWAWHFRLAVLMTSRSPWSGSRWSPTPVDAAVAGTVV